MKFIYSEKAAKFCEISTVDLSYLAPVKIKRWNGRNINFVIIWVSFKNNIHNKSTHRELFNYPMYFSGKNTLLYWAQPSSCLRNQTVMTTRKICSILQTFLFCMNSFCMNSRSSNFDLPVCNNEFNSDKGPD